MYWVVGTAIGFCVLMLGICMFFIFINATGSYHYEYRCINNVVESRQIVNGIGPLGGFDPIDGDPVGACK